MTLAEVQEETEYLLGIFHQFCRAHGLHYSLAYGTLLGAVRGGGPIPWDDDVDVAMPRPDYDRFIELYQRSPEPGTRVMAPGEPDYCCYYAKIVSLRTTSTQGGAIFPDDYGVFIDVFPLDGLPQRGASLHLAHLQLLDFMYKASYGFDLSTRASKTAKARVKNVIGMVGRLRSRDSYVRAIERALRRYPYESSPEVSNLFTEFSLDQERLPRSQAECTKSCRYGQLSVDIYTDSESVLEHAYGSNWRTPIMRDEPGHGTARWK